MGAGAIGLDSKCKGRAETQAFQKHNLELMWLPLLGNDKQCRLIAGVIRDSLLIQTQLYRSLYRGNPLGSCFLFRKGPVTGLVLGMLS